MSKKRNYTKRERRIVVRGVRREPPDLNKLSRVLLEFAAARAEAEAQAQVPASSPRERPADEQAAPGDQDA